jgi:hypothetical protein
MIDKSSVQIKMDDSSYKVKSIVSAGWTITPGERITCVAIEMKNTSTYFDNKWNNGADTVKGKYYSDLVAIENLEENKTINDTYKAGETIYMRELKKNDVFWGWLEAGEEVEEGDLLVAQYTGRFKKQHNDIFHYWESFKAAETIGPWKECYTDESEAVRLKIRVEAVSSFK